MSTLKSIATALALVTASASAGHAETLKIGVIAPLTGPGAPWGMALAESAKSAAAKVNATGGLDVGGTKYDVDILAYDDQYKASEAVAIYHNLLRQDVKYMMLVSSSGTMALKQNIEDDEVLAMTAAFTTKSVDANTTYMFRLASTPDSYIPFMAPWLAENVTEKRMVVVNPNDETGWDLTEVAEESFRGVGFEILAHELFERSQRDFQPMLTKIIASGAEIIDLGGTAPPTAGLMIRQARELGYEGKFIKTGGPGPRAILEAAGSKELVEGLLFIGYSDTSTEGYKRIAAEYTEANGHAPNEMIAPYYDASRVLLAAIAKAGDVDDTKKVATSIEEVLPMPSLQGGNLNFGTHQILSPMFVFEMQNGEPVIIDDLG